MYKIKKSILKKLAFILLLFLFSGFLLIKQGYGNWWDDLGDSLAEKAMKFPHNAWTAYYGCDEVDNLSFGQMKLLGKIQLWHDDKDSFTDSSKYESWCFNKNNVGALIKEEKNELKICERKNERTRDISRYNEINFYHHIQKCCPPEYPWNYHDTYCCDAYDLDTDDIEDKDTVRKQYCWTDTSGNDIRMSDPTSVTFSNTSSPPSRYMEQPDPIWLCMKERCLTDKDGFVVQGPRAFKDGDLTRDQYNCHISGIGWYDASGRHRICLLGNTIDKDLFDKYVNIIGIGEDAFKVCADFKETSEVDACLNCYAANKANTYSSLGCIEATQSGLVTRILQIAIGIISAVAIARIMQAAILRQSADPTKIQESYDIVVSVIIGFVVMLGSVVLMQFIGVNILGLLPFDFLK